MGTGAVVLGIDDMRAALSPQEQMLTPVITGSTAGARALSGGAVRMPPGAVSKVHRHARSEIIVAVLSGLAATVVWEDGRPRTLYHEFGQMCYVAAGVPHCAVNLSMTSEVVALEFRTDRDFNADVVLLPDLEPAAADLAWRIRFTGHGGRVAEPQRDTAIATDALAGFDAG